MSQNRAEPEYLRVCNVRDSVMPGSIIKDIYQVNKILTRVVDL